MMKFHSILVVLFVVYSVSADLLDNLEHSHDHAGHHAEHEVGHHPELHADLDTTDERIADYDDIPSAFFQFLPREDTFFEQSIIGRPLPSQLQKELDALNFLEGVASPHFDQGPQNVAVLGHTSALTSEQNSLPILQEVNAVIEENIPQEFDQFRLVPQVPSQPLLLPGNNAVDNFVPETIFVPVEEIIPLIRETILPSRETDPLFELKEEVIEEVLDILDDTAKTPIQSNFEEVSNFIGGQGRQLDQGLPQDDSHEIDRSSEEYPTFRDVPSTSFSCGDYEYGGYYADTEAECQVFHICLYGQLMGSFLCPNQTLFNQKLFVCDWWYNVDCDIAPDSYNLNSRIGVVPDDSNSIEE